MTSPSVQRFREALKVSRPLGISVHTDRNPKPVVAKIEAPYAILGRGSRCAIRLADKSVSFRHVYLQAFGDRVICVDLLSPNPIKWSGPETTDWMTTNHVVNVGPYKVQLNGDGWVKDCSGWPSPLVCKTRTDESTPFGALPLVHLELLNQHLKGMAWPINRVLTLVGRDDRCRITCADERISRVHCSLVLTPYGLWVVDLIGRGGVQVNGKAQTCALLAEGDELGVGQYRMETVYESAPRQFGEDSGQFNQDPETKEIAIPPEIADAEENLPSPEFLTRNNKIFPSQIEPPVLIVKPQGGIRSSGYQQIQLESNIITQLLITRPSLPNLVVDISNADVMDSIIMNAMMAMCRAAKGRAAICNASSGILELLSEISLTKVWPHFPTREDAINYVLNG
ncbi:MAG: FHA domain-containing protein [Planctomycetaceae bacterium]|nr:FHA domain-containing protein [Planctomycetaceae bacterium]